MDKLTADNVSKAIRIINHIGYTPEERGPYKKIMAYIYRSCAVSLTQLRWVREQFA